MPPRSRPLLALALLLIAAATPAPARAQFGSTVVRTAETVFVDPTMMTSTAYFAPTTYLSPTSYLYASPTSYYVPTSYVRTRYVAPRRYRYRPAFTATSFYDYDVTPTTYFAPTMSFAPLSATSYGSICDEPARVTTGKVETDPAPAPTGKREVAAPSDAGDRRVPPRVIRSEPKGDPGAAAKPGDIDPNSPPPSDPPPTGDAGLPPINKDDATLPGPNDVNPREVRRPIFADSAVLRGEVLSLKLNEPVPGVNVEVINRDEKAGIPPIAGMTDADGHFAIRIPTSGKWTVRIPKPGGKFLQEDFTLDARRFTDANGEFSGLTLRP